MLMFKRKIKKDKKRIALLNKNDSDTNPCIEAQDALNELCRYFLGDDYYVNMPLSQLQINAEILYEIENKYKGKR